MIPQRNQAMKRLNDIDRVETLLSVENGIILGMDEGTMQFHLKECEDGTIDIYYQDKLVYNGPDYNDAIDFILA